MLICNINPSLFISLIRRHQYVLYLKRKNLGPISSSGIDLLQYKCRVPLLVPSFSLPVRTTVTDTRKSLLTFINPYYLVRLDGVFPCIKYSNQTPNLFNKILRIRSNRTRVNDASNTSVYNRTQFIERRSRGRERIDTFNRHSLSVTPTRPVVIYHIVRLWTLETLYSLIKTN